MKVTRQELRSVITEPVDWTKSGPLQLAMGSDPWRVAIASMLCVQSPGSRARPVLQALLERYPTASHMEQAEDLEALLAPLGLHRNRARWMQRFSALYPLDTWGELRDLPGVGAYVSDAVGVFCLGRTDIESNDAILRGYIDGRNA